MPDHKGFLKRLWEALPGQVHLVGLYSDPELGLPKDGVLRIFLPDFHWLSAKNLERYPQGYGFNGNLRLPPKGQPIFGTLLDVLEDVQEFDVPEGKTGLEVFQLGDAYDLWREMAAGEKDAGGAYRRIRQDPSLDLIIGRLDKLSIKHVLGNHDQWLGKLDADALSLPVPETKSSWSTAGERILLTHGHEYDPIEMGLPDEIQASAVRIWTNLKAGKHPVGLFSKRSRNDFLGVLKLRERGLRKDFYPTVEPDGAFLIESEDDLAACGKSYDTYLDVSRFSRVPGSSNDFDHVDYLRYADEMAAGELNHPLDHSVHVIGHTHQARLLVDRISPGRPFVTLDCGGWIGQCKIKVKGRKQTIYVPSAQLGVQSGNDLRLYQLGGLG